MALLKEAEELLETLGDSQEDLSNVYAIDGEEAQEITLDWSPRGRATAMIEKLRKYRENNP